MKLEQSYLYTETHEWIKIDGGTALVGISDYAQEHLGEIVFLDMPETGKTVAAGDELAVVESVKGVATIYSPVAGTVSEINESLSDNPGDVNKDPFGAWIVKLSLTGTPDLGKLLAPAAYEAHCKKEQAN